MNQSLQTLLHKSTDMNDEFKLTDERLIKQFQEGDRHAFDELVKRYKDRLHNFVCRYLNNQTLAEDVVQETMIKLYNKYKAIKVSICSMVTKQPDFDFWLKYHLDFLIHGLQVNDTRHQWHQE